MYLGVLGVIAKKYWGWEGFRQTCRQKKLQCGVLSPSIAKGPKHKKTLLVARQSFLLAPCNPSCSLGLMLSVAIEISCPSRH